MKKPEYSNEELIQRAFLRLSRHLFDLWEEGDEAHTRLFEWLIPDGYVLRGTSKRGAGRREHAVPCKMLRERAFDLFEQGATPEIVAKELQKHLLLLYIHRDEARHLDKTLGLKNRMPEGWKWDSGDPLARIRAAGIELMSRDDSELM